MPSLLEIAGLVGLVAAVVYWFDAMRGYELARAAGQRACRDAGVQLLDDTVQLVRLRLGRTPDGRLRLRREYRFEFTDNGAARHRGQVTLLGRRVLHLALGS
jgi:hypothetical protein